MAGLKRQVSAQRQIVWWGFRHQTRTHYSTIDYALYMHGKNCTYMLPEITLYTVPGGTAVGDKLRIERRIITYPSTATV